MSLSSVQEKSVYPICNKGISVPQQ